MSILMKTAVLLMVLIPGIMAYHKVYKTGNISIGSLISLHKENNGNYCTRFYLPGLNRVEAIMYTVNKINNNSELLRNVSLGYDIRDYCNDRSLAMKEAYDFTKRNSLSFDLVEESSLAKLTCRKCVEGLQNGSDSIVAVIGPYGSRNSLQVAGLLQVVGMAGISPSATSEELSWSFYSQFFRTVPPDNYQAKAMADLIDKFQWNYIAAVAVEHSYGLYGIRALERESMERKTFCIGFIEYVSPTAYQRQLETIVTKLKAAQNIKVVALWIEDRIAKDLMREAARQKVHYRVWLMSDSLATKTPEFLGPDFIYLGLYLGIQPKQYRDLEYENHIRTMTPKKSLQSGNTYWEKLWKEEFNCDVVSKNSSVNSKICPENLTITETVFQKLWDDFIPYQVDAVYAVAHALDSIYRCTNGSGLLEGGACPSTSLSINPHHVLLYLRQVDFEGITGRIKFDKNGDPHGSSYDIISFQKDQSSRYTKVRVGSWDKNSSPRLRIFQDSIAWNSSFKGIPKSVCKGICQPGTMQTRTVVCCWECLKCPDGTVSTSYGQRNCSSCTTTQRSNDNRTNCIDLPIITLQWSDITAIVIAAVTSLGLLLCLFIMFIFYVHRATPIVKASNKELSSVVLFAIIFCFILTFLHILHPSDTICSVVEPFRYISFTTCVSVLVLKTIRILRAFETRAMFQWLNKHFIFDTKKQLILVLLMNVPQVILSILWKTIDPALVKTEVVVKVSILLSCQLYKTRTGFTLHMCMVAYLIMWSMFCAYYAFKARNLPENFNEAKYIGFSMYTLLLSWVTYFPVQNTLDGWYVSVVSCVTILVSSYGFLLCIFAPKIYLIILHPERNTPDVVRSTMRQNKISTITPCTQIAERFDRTISQISQADSKYVIGDTQT